MKMKITIFLTALFMTGLTYAQNFKGHVSGTYGSVNEKIRLQCELPLDSQVSYGINMNYYFKLVCIEITYIFITFTRFIFFHLNIFLFLLFVFFFSSLLCNLKVLSILIQSVRPTKKSIQQLLYNQSLFKQRW